MLGPVTIVIGTGILLLLTGVKVLKEFERAVVFRLGRLTGHRGPGIIYIIPLLERWVRVDLRTSTWDIPRQDVITRDNVSVKVNAVLYFRVVEPNRAIVEVEDFLQATSQLAQTTLRSVCGQRELDELLAERDRVNQHVQEMLDAQTEPWGIKVVSVELKHIDLPEEMQRAMARQAEAERERRAKVINAEGEFQAAERLAEASAILGQHPIALRLRFLQTLGEIASENNSTTVFPLPVDLLAPFLGAGGDGVTGGGTPAPTSGPAAPGGRPQAEDTE
jgi:regulator of protease activity HflC (stomatin/prohibitin superfamily)